MKKILIAFLVLMACPAVSDTLQYRTDISPKLFNDVWNRQFDARMRIDYDKDDDWFHIYIYETMDTTGFALTREQADALIESLDKYKEWNIKASSKSVTLEKEIAKVSSAGGFWQTGKTDWRFGTSFELTALFFSQSPQIHQYVIVFPRFQQKDNEYLSHKPETIYFGYKEAIKLRNALTRASVKSFLVEAKKQAEIEAEFN